MPAAAVTRQVQIIEQESGVDEDYSTVVRLMRELAGLESPQAPAPGDSSHVV